MRDSIPNFCTSVTLLCLLVSSAHRCVLTHSFVPACLARVRLTTLCLDVLWSKEQIVPSPSRMVAERRWLHSGTASGRTRSSHCSTDGSNRRNARSLGPSWTASAGSRHRDTSKWKHEWVLEVHTQQRDDARQLQRYGSHEVLRQGVRDVELLECWRPRARGRHPAVDHAGTRGCR